MTTPICRSQNLHVKLDPSVSGFPFQKGKKTLLFKKPTFTIPINSNKDKIKTLLCTFDLKRSIINSV